MSDESKSGGAAADASGAQDGTQSKDNKKFISAEDHERALADLHKHKKLAKEYADKAAAFEQEKLLAEGKKDDVINTLKKQVAERDAKFAEMQKKQAWDKVSGWLKMKAASSGVVDGGAVDKFVTLVDFKGKNPFRNEETFEIEETVLGQVFEDSKKDMPYFFSKPGPNVKDTNPGSGASTPSNNGSDYSKLSLDQMRDEARKHSVAKT